MTHHAQLARGVRRKLPDLRPGGYTRKVVIEHPDNKLYIRTGQYDDGTLGEIFLDMHRQGTLIQALMHGFAVAISTGLQYGVPLEEYVDLFVGFQVRPSGPVSHHECITSATSILDLVFRDLGIKYLNRRELCNTSVIEKKNGNHPTEGVIAITRGQRKILPARREGYTQKVKVGGQKLYLRTGLYADGHLGEIFLDMGKEGDDIRSFMHAFAMAISMGLQFGVPLSEYVDSFVGARFEPAGEVKGDSHVVRAQSYFDYVFRHLAVEFLGRTELAHKKPSAEQTAEQP